MTPEDKAKIKRFLFAALNSYESLDSLLRACQLTPREFYQVARSTLVRRWIRRITRNTAAAMRELEVSRSALCAAEQMSERIAGRVDRSDPDLKESVRKLWVDAIKLARAREDREDAMDRAAETRESKDRESESRPRDITELVSPDVPHDVAAQILARMLRRRDADGGASATPTEKVEHNDAPAPSLTLPQ